MCVEWVGIQIYVYTIFNNIYQYNCISYIICYFNSVILSTNDERIKFFNKIHEYTNIVTVKKKNCLMYGMF